MKDNTIRTKSFAFALRTVKHSSALNAKKEFILSRQLLRSGTAIGALVRESEYAESRPDFIHKLSIALKEANETEYWMELLFKSEFISESVFTQTASDLKEILRLLTSIIRTSKLNLKK